MREQRRGDPTVSSFALALLDHLQRLRLVELRFNTLDRFSIPEERQRVDGVRIRARAIHDVATVGSTSRRESWAREISRVLHCPRAHWHSAQIYRDSPLLRDVGKTSPVARPAR